MNEVVCIMERETVKDALGQPSTKWNDGQWLFAALRRTNGGMKDKADRESETQTITFRVRQTPTLECLPVDARLKWKNKIYKVKSSTPPPYDRGSYLDIVVAF